MTKEKPVIFRGTGYRIIRSDPRNLVLEVLGAGKDGKEGYQFKGYFSTIEQALANIVRNSYLLDETMVHDINSYIKSILETKETVIRDIAKQVKNTESETSLEIDLDDELFN